MKSPIPQLCATQAREPALLVSLLIGTNNLTRGKLLINALLPRGERSMCICMCMPHVYAACVCMGCRRAATAA